MYGFTGDTPIVVKNVNSSSKQVISLEELYKKLERKNSNIKNWRVWSPDGWNNILEVKRDKTKLNIHRISNCYNWLYATQNIKFLLGIREIIDIEDIKFDTNLFMCDYLENNIENMEEEKKKFISNEEFKGSNRLRCNNLSDIQKNLLMGNFLDFHMKIDCADIPDYVCYNSSMEQYIKNINKEFPPLWYRNYKRNKAKNADLLREHYQQYLKDFFPRNYLNRTLTNINNKLWDISDEFKNEMEEYLNGKYISFSYENDFIYNLKSEKGMFNIGAGQLVVVE
tara:strand:+ start:1461 stop:2306 length:846 start_codon:yes stop_codon:yes gene_type:complete